MGYQIKTYDDILSAILTDYANQIPGADISEGSDLYIKAAALASVLWGIYQYQAWTSRQVFPDSADSEELERHASIRGLSRKQATKGSGTVTLTGTTGLVVSAGLSLSTAEGVLFETTTGGTITLGELVVTAQAVEGGVSGNIPNATALTVQDPPAGVDSAAVSAAAFAGGADKESDADLLSRLLDIIRQPPAGGNKGDYKNWALEVEGVDEAFVYPLRLGLGSVTVVPLVAGSGAGRVPGQELIDAVVAHIDELRPVSVKIFQVLAPTPLSQAVTAEIKVSTGYTFNQVQPWVEAAVNSFLNEMDPAETLYRSKLERVISDVEGVEDRSVTTPAGNVTPADSGATIEMVCPGAITITEMP